MSEKPEQKPNPKSDILKQAMQEPAPPDQSKPAAPASPQPSQPAVSSGQPTPTTPTTPSQTPATSTQPPAAQKPPPKKKRHSNRLLVGCLSAIGVTVLLMFVVLIIFFASSNIDDNPILQLFGIEPGNLKDLLINLTHGIFMFLVFITFITTLVGLFRFSLVKKDDKAARRKGLSMMLISLLLFILFIFLWLSAYFYLENTMSDPPERPEEYIVTDPTVTLDLSAPLEIKFDASNIIFDELRYKIMAYQWKFGDGATATGKIVSHRYLKKGPEDGSYEVLLDITYKVLKTGEEKTAHYTTDVIFSNEKVNALFSVDTKEGEAPLTVTFDASESFDPDGEVVAYDWDFNEDGVYDDLSGQQVSYTFEQGGVYTVGLRVTDNNNEYDIYSMEIEATSPSLPQAVIKSEVTDGHYYVNQVYTFEAGDSESPNGTIEGYSWDFGDDSNAVTTRTATHKFEETGIYLIILEVTDDTEAIGETSLEIKVEVPESAPVAVITTIPAVSADQAYLSGEPPFEVQFDASGSLDADDNIVDYMWDFDGDGESDATGIQTQYIYKEVGEYNVSLTVIDAEDNESKQTLIIKVLAPGLQAVISADPIQGEAPLKVHFDASGSTYEGGEIVSYKWNFGDDSAPQIYDANVTYEYKNIGNYTAKVTVSGSDGKEDSNEIQINVRPVKLSACFESNVKKGPAPLTVTFDPNCSTGRVEKYEWDFGGEISRERRPIHTFENPGVYDVKLEVTSENLIDEYTAQITVLGALEE